MSASPALERVPSASASATGFAARVLAAGAGGGALLAGWDFSASWLWLHEPSGRARLALYLLGLLPAVGASLCALGLGVELLARRVALRAPVGAPALVDAAESSARPAALRVWVSLRARPSALRAWLIVALASPATFVLARSLFEGGRASRLPHREAWVAGASLALSALLVLAFRAGLALARLRARSWAARAGLALVLLACAFAASKADQTLYPRLYAGPHAVLGLAAWGAASLALWLLAPLPLARLDARWLGAALACALAATLACLHGDHDGRAALLSPRASSARSVMLALAPAMFAITRDGVSAEAVSRARRAADVRRRALRSGDLPELAGAHVVVVTIDALRADHLGAYGHSRPTSPALDALAAQSVLFERAWTPTPRSSYALVSLMIGAPVHRLLEEGRASPERTLADALSERGYHTAAFYPEGIFFHEGARLERYRARELGFARRDAEDRDAESLTDAVLAELEDLRSRGEPPTLLWAHYFDVHEPYEDARFGRAPIDRYDGDLRRVDAAFARLREGLRGLEREVVLVVTADHGEEFGDHGGAFHGGALYEEQLRVPLLVAAPGLAPRRVATPVSLVDLAPTLLALVGSDPRVLVGQRGRSAERSGIDLRPALVGRPLERGPIGATEEGLRAVLAWPLKLVEDERVGSVEVYDLASDPRERESLAGDRPDLVGTLRAELEALP